MSIKISHTDHITPAIADQFDQFCEKNYKPGSRCTYRYAIQYLIAAHLPIDKNLLSALDRQLAERPRKLARNTINLRIRAATALIFWLQEQGYLVEDFPYEAAKRIRRRRSGASAPAKYIVNMPAVEELANAIKAYVESDFNGQEALHLHKLCMWRTHAMVQVAISSGVRIAEVSMIKKADINDEGLFLVFGKGGKYRTAIMSKEALSIVRTYLAMREDDNPYVFVSHRSYNVVPMTPQTLRQALHDAKIPAGVPKNRVTPHDFRRYLATDMLASGEPPHVIQRVLGHASIKTTLDIYAHVQPKAVVDAVLGYHAKKAEQIANSID